MIPPAPTRTRWWRLLSPESESDSLLLLLVLPPGDDELLLPLLLPLLLLELELEELDDEEDEEGWLRFIFPLSILLRRPAWIESSDMVHREGQGFSPPANWDEWLEIGSVRNCRRWGRTRTHPHSSSSWKHCRTTFWKRSEQ